MQLDYSHRSILKVALPLMLSSVVEHLIGLVDAALLSNLSDEELGGAGLGIHMYFFFFMVGYGMCSGLQIILSRKYGAEQKESMGSYFLHGTGLILMASLLAVAIIFGASESVLTHVIQSDQVLVHLNSYLQTRSWGIIFTLLSATFGAYFISVGKSYYITISSLFILLTNWVLDIALINGHWGFPELRVEGAAVASLIASIVGASLLFVFSIYHARKEGIPLYQWSGFDKDRLKELWVVSYPLMGQFFIAFLGWTFFFFIVEKMGSEALSISSLVRPIYIIFLLPFIAIGNTTSSLTSNLIGQNKEAQLPKLLKNLVQTSLIGSLIISTIGYLNANLILNIVSDNQVLIKASEPTLKTIFTAIPIYSVSTVFFYMVIGTGDTRKSMLIEISSILIYMIPVYLFVIVFELPIHWVWTTEHIYFLSFGLMSAWLILTGKYKLNKFA